MRRLKSSLGERRWQLDHDGTGEDGGSKDREGIFEAQPTEMKQRRSWVFACMFG